MTRCLKRLAAVSLFLGMPVLAGAAPGVPETKTLANGMPVVVLEDHTLPLVSVSLWVHAGSKDEIETSAGYAHYLEHLVQRGTETAGPFEYQRLAHRWGGTLAVRSNYDRTYITATGVSSVLGEIVEAVASMGLRATLEDKEIDQELGTLSQEIRSYYDEPSSVAFFESMRAAFPKHPYRFPPLGNYKTIGTLKHDPIVAFYKNLYVPNNMALVLAGDLDPTRARDLAERSFGKAAASGTLPRKPDSPAEFAGHDDKEKPLEVNESWTTLSFVGPGYRHPDRPAFEILARALGDAGGAPILNALARSGAGSRAQVIFYRLEDAGLLYVSLAPATPELSYSAAASALETIVGLKQRGLKEDEVKTQVRRILKEERLKAERLDTLSEALGEAALFGGARYYWDLPDQYARLTAAEVNRVAAKYLVAENLRLVLIVPKKAAPPTEERKSQFHQALDHLGGMARDAPPPGLERRLYAGDETLRLHAEAWGDPRDARAARPPVVSALKDGLSVVVKEDHRRPLVGVSLTLPFGSGDDPQGKEGLAYVAAHLLSPAPGVPAQGEAVRLGEKLVLLPEIEVTRDLTEIRFLAQPADLRAALAALADAVLHPAIGDTVFESVRTGTRHALERAAADPAFLSLDLFREKVYAGHPYSHATLGTSTGLGSLQRADVETFLKSSLRPKGSALALAGDVTAAEVQKMAQALFAGWKTGPAPAVEGRAPAAGDTGERPGDAAADGAPAPASKNPANRGAAAGEFTRLVDSPQSSVIVGVPGAVIGDPDFDDLRVLGAGLTVLAFEDMVFGRRAAFSATALPEALERGGSFALAVVAQHARRDEAVFDVQRLMRRLTLQDLDQKDVDDFARVETGREAAALQGVLATASTLSYRDAAGLPATSPRIDPSASGSGPGRLRGLAARYLRPEAWIVIKVGPASP